MVEGQVEGLGTGLPCLSQITFFCDLLLLYVDEEAHFYWRTKYEEVSHGPVQILGFCYTLEDVGQSPDMMFSFAGKGSEGDHQPRADRTSFCTPVHGCPGVLEGTQSGSQTPTPE